MRLDKDVKGVLVILDVVFKDNNVLREEFSSSR